MKWAHLPLAGGLSDQHPDFVANCFYLFQQRAIMENKKAKEEERKRDIEAKSAQRKGGRVAGRRR